MGAVRDQPFRRFYPVLQTKPSAFLEVASSSQTTYPFWISWEVFDIACQHQLSTRHVAANIRGCNIALDV